MKVEVLTGDVSKAGTNANVYLTLNTENGSGSPYKLNHRISGDAFERNDHDVLYINDHDVYHQLNSINIRHDNKGSGSGWYLQELKITDPSGMVKRFPCDCWMEGSENGRTLFHKAGTSLPKTVYIQSSIDDKYLDVKNGSEKNGTPMHIWNSNKSKAQQFKIEPAGGNYFYIKSAVGENKYLHIEGVSPHQEARVVLWDGKGGDNTKWLIEANKDSDYYTIRSKMGTYLDVQWAASKNGTPVWMWNGNGGRAQMWRFMHEVDGALKAKRF